MKKILYFCSGVFFLFLFLHYSEQTVYAIAFQQKEIEQKTISQSTKTPTEKKLEDEIHLTDIQSLDNSILVELKYATTDNFTKKILYKDLKRAYLQPEAAAKLAKAQQYLKKQHPEMNLLVYDAVRPLNVQKEMYETVKNTPYHRYVAEPGRTGLHNYGAAVDLTITDASNKPLDMGTPFDFFGKAAGIGNEDELVRQGILTRQQVKNRQLLRNVMVQAGFRTIRGEWWHFNHCSLAEAKAKYRLIEHF